MKNKKNILSLLFLSALLISGCGSSNTDSITLNTYEDLLDFHSLLQQEYLSNDDPSVLPSLLDGRNEYGKPEAIAISWRDTKNQTYEFEYSESNDFSNSKIINTSSKSVDLVNLKLGTKYFYRVKVGNDSTQVSSFSTVDYGPRNIDIDGVTNVRDIGGWKLQDGHTIKQGLLYRGARLNNSYPDGFQKNDDIGYLYEAEITEKGKKTFKDELGIKTEVDFRVLERNGFPGKDKTEENVFPNVDGTNFIQIPTDGSADIRVSKEEIKEFFTLLGDKSNYPLYYHCNIGTDRTGMMSYLLGAYLGMIQKDLYRDYLFSDFGLIAMPTPFSSNPKIKELKSLTSGSGAEAIVMTYNGESLSEKAKECLLDCGISNDILTSIKNILVD